MGAVCEQVADGHGQIVVGVHQARSGRNDAVPVRVRVIGKGEAILVLEADQPGHGIRAGAVHADLAIVIDRHEREGRVDGRVDDRNVHVVHDVNQLPVGRGSAAQWIHAQREARSADGVHVDDVAQVVDIGHNKIFLVRARRLHGGGEGHALDASVASPQQFIGPLLNPVRHVSVGRAAVGRVVLEATVLGRIV